FIGDAAATAATAAARCHLVEEHPSIEVEIKDGGQPLHPYLISVE
ncbi:MAG TPA: hypothetical protein ENH33_02170, partial [Actinobacteria bacterium]|nr:hypothetical protein [Actinomycetota bacterium]